MSRLTAVIIAITILLASNVISWRSGWSSHADHINAQASKKREKAESTIKPVEEKAATANEAGKVIYKTITRDVVKYVQSPNRIVCRFDDDAVQLRQRAIEHLLQAELLGRLQSNLIAHQHGPEHRDQASHEEDQHHNAREGTQFRG